MYPFFARHCREAQDADFKRRIQDDIKANARKFYERDDTVREMGTFFIAAYQAWQAGDIVRT